MDTIEVIDGIHRLADSGEDPVQALWRMENESRATHTRRRLHPDPDDD